MPCSCAVLDDGRLVLERWWGEVFSAEIVAHEAGQLEDERIAPGAAGLADLRAAAFPGEEPLDVRAIAATHGGEGHRNRFARYALVTDEADTFLRSRVFEREMEPFGVRVVVFVSLATACTWLGADPARIRTALEALGG